MSTIIVGLLNIGTWEIIFTTCFFFGLIFFIFVILGAIGSDDADVDHDTSAIDTDGIDIDGDGIADGVGIDIDGDGVIDGIDIDGDGIIDHSFHVDADSLHVDADSLHVDADGLHVDTDGLHVDTDGLDIDTDSLHIDTDGTHLDVDSQEISFDHLSIDSNIEADAAYKEFKSKYLMGNLTVFLYVFGLLGWMNLNQLRDHHLLIAIVTGLIAARFFAWIIANFAKTVIVPVVNIRRGDVGLVVYGVTPEKAGMVQVKRRDGMISTIMAKGAFPHDYFSKNERGYIWGIENEIYLLTRGVIGQPDLNPDNQSKPVKKPLDI